MILKPNHISTNSQSALIAPSGIVRKEKLQKAINNVSSLNIVANDYFPTRKNHGYLAETDSNRLKELENSFRDKNIDTIFCIRGGYGTTRYLDKIDYEIIRQNPKIFIGFSDITALQSAFFVKTGLVTFHGIVAASEFSDYTIEQLQNLLFQPSENYILPTKSMKILNEGTAEGKIVGGNLSLLTSLIGTEYLYSFKNNIVFIEEIAEPPYKIDRMLTHLLMASDFKEASALVFGKFHKCEPENYNMKPSESFTIAQIIKQNFSNLKMPIIFDVNFGHIENSLIFPIGVKAIVKTNKYQIKLLEKAVL